MRPAVAAYTLLALAATWPLGAGLARDVAWDLGDSLLNMWILAWDCEQLLAILGGDVGRLATFFDANIFHPAPLTLAFSEHLLPQALQVLPIYAVTGNPILCYNLLFLSTFVLSAAGAWLLVRDLTGSRLAALAAGLLYAWAPYRLAQSPHLQVLSAQWMPFALYWMRRYLADPTHRRPLLLSTLAFVAQGLSCGYYLFYFAPFLATFALWEVARHARWRDRRVWMDLTGAALLAGALTVPLLLPYLAARDLFRQQRSLPEVASLSADIHAYATALVDQPLWGSRLQAFPRAEGELFPGVATLLLAAIGLVAGGARAGSARPAVETATATGTDTSLTARRFAAGACAALAAAHAALIVAVLVWRRITFDIGPLEIRATSVTPLIVRAAIAAALWLALSPAARIRTARFLSSRGYFALALVAAVWLSLGPEPTSLGRPLDLAAPYRWLMAHVPGVDGLRVPARFAMIAALLLAVLAGYGTARLAPVRGGRFVVGLLLVLALLEGTRIPFTVNGTTASPGFEAPEARVYPPSRAPRIYREGVVPLGTSVGALAELPLGVSDYDARAVYYSTVHWRPLVNGYSGYVPPHYGSLIGATGGILRQPDSAVAALAAVGTTHVIVHERAFPGDQGPATSRALAGAGARELMRADSDVLFALSR